MKKMLSYILAIILGSCLVYFSLVKFVPQEKTNNSNKNSDFTKTSDSSNTNSNLLPDNNENNIDNHDQTTNNLTSDSSEKIDSNNATNSNINTNNSSVKTDNHSYDNNKTNSSNNNRVINQTKSVKSIDVLSYYALTPNYDFDIPVKITYDDNTSTNSKSNCTFKSLNPSIVGVNNNHIVTSSKTTDDNPITVTISCGNVSKQVKVTVSSLIHDKNNKKYLASPKLHDFDNKLFIGCSLRTSIYPNSSLITNYNLSNTQIKRLNNILDEKVKAAGYGTRAGVVEAARFLAINFPFKVPYAYGDWKKNDVINDSERTSAFVSYENSNIKTNKSISNPYGIPSQNNLIFGRYYSYGINVFNKSLFPEYEQVYVGSNAYGSGYKVNIKNDSSKVNYSWGCQVGKQDHNNTLGSAVGYSQIGRSTKDTYYLNGLDCTGFIYWALINGGYIPTRNTDDDKKYNIDSTNFYGMIAGNNATNNDDIVKLHEYDKDKNLIKVGDLTFNNSEGEAHIGIIIGIDDTYYYIAEETGYVIRNDVNDTQLKRAGLVVSRTCIDKNKCPGDDNTDKKRFTRVLLMRNVYKNGDGNLTDMWES